MRRVVITGAGTVNPLGADLETTLAAMAAGQVAIGPLDIPDLDRLSVQIGAQVQGFDPATHFDRGRMSLLDRAAQFALVSARQALAQAGLVAGDAALEQAGVIIGTAGGGLTTTDDAYRAVYQQGKNRVPPLTVPRLMPSAAPSLIGMEFGLIGPTFAVSSACASSNHAIGLALQLVQSGATPLMLAGGAEAMLCFGGLKVWEGLRVMSPDACRPFSDDRNGMVMGEGAAVLVIEDYDHARARGAVILAELAGFAMTADAADIVMPSRIGAVRAMQGAMAQAGLSATEVGYINAHGTATRANDREEALAIHQVFGADVAGLAVSSTKSLHGHLIGAAGAVEILACLLALRDGVIAPTAGHRVHDPEIGLDVVPNAAREKRVAAVLSNAFAFGGLNATLALRAAP